MAAFLPAAVLLGGGASKYAVIVLCALGLFAVGTLDDRVGLGPLERVLAEVAAATALWGAGLAWYVSEIEAVNLLLTIVWVVGLVNAFNLMDNLDGAAGSVTAVAAAGGGRAGRDRGRHPARRAGPEPGGRLRRLPAVQPRQARADLPRRRRQHAGRLCRGRRRDGDLA